MKPSRTLSVVKYTLCCLLLLLSKAETNRRFSAACAPNPKHRNINFRQTHFAIGIWVDPPVDEAAAERYQLLSQANFNLVIGGFGARSQVQRERQVGLCNTLGLKLILGRTHNDKFTENGDSVWGYAIQDEPSAEDFPAIAQKMQTLGQTRPGKLGFVNLFPTYADSSQLGCDNYGDYLQTYMDVVQPEVLCVDHYPFLSPDGDTKQMLCENLRLLRAASIKAHIPFWTFFNAMAYGSHSRPSEGQLNWQMYVALAYGAKGLNYFCYCTPDGAEFVNSVALIDRQGKPSSQYFLAKNINPRIFRIGERLLNCESRRVYRSENRPDNSAVQLAKGTDLLVGEFIDTKRQRLALIVNFDDLKAKSATLKFDCPRDKILELNQNSGALERLAENTETQFQPGEGKLFILPPTGDI